MITIHHDYNKLGGKILMSNLHKSVNYDYKKVVNILYNNYRKEKYIDEKTYEIKEEQKSIANKNITEEEENTI